MFHTVNSHLRLFCLLFVTLALLSVPHEALGWSWAAVSYYKIIERAPDVVIIRVVRVDGGEFSQKAVAVVERSFKGVVTSDSIELPFVYKSWPTGKGTYQMVSDIVPVSFEAGKRYCVILTPWHRFNFGPPNAPQTQYEVLNYPKKTFFEIADEGDARVQEIKELISISRLPDADARMVSLLAMLNRGDKEHRIDAIEALIDLKSEGAIKSFINVLKHDPEPDVRWKAALGLGYFRSDSILTALMECAKTEKDRNVEFWIVASLGKQRSPKTIPLLILLYDSVGYDIRNIILQDLSAESDTTLLPTLFGWFENTGDRSRRRQLAEMIAHYHTPAADTFSSALLDTAGNYWMKTAVMEGWTLSHYTAGFQRLVRWTEVPCAEGRSPSRAFSEEQTLVFPLLRAIEKLGTPEQIASALKVYAECADPVVRREAVRILQTQLDKNITPELRKEIETIMQSFSWHE